MAQASRSYALHRLRPAPLPQLACAGSVAQSGPGALAVSCGRGEASAMPARVSGTQSSGTEAQLRRGKAYAKRAGFAERSSARLLSAWNAIEGSSALLMPMSATLMIPLVQLKIEYVLASYMRRFEKHHEQYSQKSLLLHIKYDLVE